MNRPDYYDELHKCADQIILEKELRKNKFTGEIWALTCFLDDEWEDEGYEKLWVDKLKKADSVGVPTRHLCIFPPKIIELLQSDNEVEIRKFLDEWKDFCKKTGSNEWKNTQSFAIMEKQLGQSMLEALGKGFFATSQTNGSKILIRDVSIDNIKSNSLLGEIDFNEQRIDKTWQQWELVLNSARPLDKFLCQKGTHSATTKLVLEDLKILS